MVDGRSRTKILDGSMLGCRGIALRNLGDVEHVEGSIRVRTEPVEDVMRSNCGEGSN